MLKLDKIFTTLSSKAFLHRCSQHKIKIPRRGFKNSIILINAAVKQLEMIT